jgi:hypothetical protein
MVHSRTAQRRPHAPASPMLGAWQLPTFPGPPPRCSRRRARLPGSASRASWWRPCPSCSASTPASPSCSWPPAVGPAAGWGSRCGSTSLRPNTSATMPPAPQSTCSSTRPPEPRSSWSPALLRPTRSWSAMWSRHSKGTRCVPTRCCGRRARARAPAGPATTRADVRAWYRTSPPPRSRRRRSPRARWCGPIGASSSSWSRRPTRNGSGGGSRYRRSCCRRCCCRRCCGRRRRSRPVGAGRRQGRRARGGARGPGHP